MSTSMQHTEAVMQGLASGVDSILNGDMMDPLNTGRKYGFVLLVAEFGDIAEGRVNYVSNGDCYQRNSRSHPHQGRYQDGGRA